MVLAAVPLIPTVLGHTPGVADVMVGAISRLSVPGVKDEIPQALLNAPRDRVPKRDESFYRSTKTRRFQGQQGGTTIDLMEGSDTIAGSGTSEPLAFQ